MKSYKEDEITSGNKEIGELSSTSEQEYLEEIKAAISAINTYLKEVEIPDDPHAFIDLQRFASNDSQVVANLVENENFLPTLMNNLKSLEDIETVAYCLECICTIAIRFPDQQNPEDFINLIEVYDKLMHGETQNERALLYSVCSLSVYITPEIIKDKLRPDFYSSLIPLIMISRELFHVCSIFAYKYVRIADKLEKDSEAMIMVFTVLYCKPELINVFCAKTLKELIKRKALPLDNEKIQELLHNYLEIKKPEIMKELLKGISYVDEEYIKTFENENFYNYIREIVNISEDDHEYDEMKVSAYSTLSRFSQLVPYSNKDLFFEPESGIISKVIEAVSHGSINVRMQAGVLLARLFYAFPKDFVNMFIEQEDEIVDAVVGILSSEKESTVLLIQGLQEISKTNNDALFAMGDAGIIDVIEDMISSFEEDVADIAQSFIDYAHEIFDDSEGD